MQLQGDCRAGQIFNDSVLESSRPPISVPFSTPGEVGAGCSSESSKIKPLSNNNQDIFLSDYGDNR
jgi:hypothetical protein